MNTQTTEMVPVETAKTPGVVDMLDNLLNGRLSALNSQACTIFSDLVARGEKVEQQFKARIGNKVGENTMLDKPVSSLFSKLGLSNNKQDEQLEELSVKVDQLIQVVGKLAEMQDKKAPAAAKPRTTRRASTAKKPAASKSTTTAKPAAKPTAKPAAKPAAKTTTKAKPAAKKTAAKPAAKPADKPAE